MDWDAIPPSATLNLAPLAEALGLAILADHFLDDFVDRVIRYVDRGTQVVHAA